MAIRAAWSLATLLGLASPALAEDCRLALVLALDVSGSVDAQEDLLQREGLAHALLARTWFKRFSGVIRLLFTPLSGRATDPRPSSCPTGS